MTSSGGAGLTAEQRVLLEAALGLFCFRHPELEAEVGVALESLAGPTALAAAVDLEARLLDVQSRLPILIQAADALIVAVPAQGTT